MRTPSAPTARAAWARSTTAAVALPPAPASTRARPRATSTVTAITCCCSSALNVALSPVVPHGTSTRTPPAIWRSTSARKHASSTAPPGPKGVTKAVAHPRSQSTRMFALLPCDSTPRAREEVVHHVVEGEHTASAADPGGREERTRGKPLPRPGRVFEGDLVGGGVEPHPVRARNVSGAGARDRDRPV